MDWSIVVKTPSASFTIPVTKSGSLRAISRAQKMLWIAEHYLTDKNVEPMDYGYPAFSPAPRG